MRQRGRKPSLAWQVAGAFLWGAFLSIAPFDVLFVGAIFWIPLFIWRERVRAARHGFWPGALWRYGIIAGVVALAALAPTKIEDGKVGPLPGTTVTLGELAAAGAISPLRDRRQVTTRVSLPSLTPTRREVMAAITQQTGLTASISHSGNGASILTGSGYGPIRVSER